MTVEQMLQARHYLMQAKSQMAKRADNSAAEFSALCAAEAVLNCNLRLISRIHNLRDTSNNGIMLAFNDFMTEINNA